MAAPLCRSPIRRQPGTTIVALAAFVAALSVVAPAAQAAMQQPWVARHYGSADGLPVNSVRSAALDADGFLWLATHDGLARFDGEHFEVYDSMRAPAMSGNRVVSLYKDGTGQLYAWTKRGDWLRIRSGHIERVNMGVDGPQGVRYVDPHSLCVTTATAMHCPDGHGAFPTYVRFPKGVNVALAVRGSDDSAWMLTSAYNIWLYRHGAWRAVWQGGSLLNTYPPLRAAVDADGSLWTTFGDWAVRVTLDGARSYFTGDADPHYIFQLRRSADGHIWLEAVNGVFVVRAGQPRQVLEHPDFEREFSYRSWRAPDGALWVAHDKSLWRLTLNAHDRAALPPPVLVCNGAIQDVLFGPGKLVWVMTLSDGFYRLNRSRVDILGPDDGLRGGNVYSVSRAVDGNMWLGTLDNGIFEVTTDGKIQHYHVSNAAGLVNRNSWLVASAPDGSLYVATYTPGLWRWPPGGKQAQPLPLPDALQHEHVLAVTFDASGQPWIGTTVGAWRESAGHWQRVWPRSLRRITVNDIVLSDQGAWFATDQGVWYQSGHSEHPVATGLLAHTTVRNLRFTRDGALWISTVGHGLVRVAADDPLGLHPLQLGRAQGLPSNSPHTIREDAEGNIWVNSNQGIYRISPAGLHALLAGKRHKLSPLVLGRSDGLTELEGNGGVQPAAAWDSRGRLWFPSQAGVVRFDPLAVQPRGQPPRPVITAVQSEGRDVTLSADGSLPLGVRSLRFVYGAANLFGSGQSRFRYRLLPQGNGWIATTAVRSAVFTGLSPGQYRFEIVAANSDGVWTQKPTVFKFEVPAYWYETTWFRIAAVVVGLLLLVLLVQWRLSRMRRQAKVLGRQVQERTRELKQANIALERAANHDFLTDLPNRRAFVKTIDAALASGEPLALAILDLDFFKAYNDNLGHVAGDRCLIQFAALLKAQGALPGVLASRVGGEEFALLFEGEEVKTAGDILDALVNALHDLELRHPASAAGDRISFSGGLAVRRAGDKRAEDLFRRADAALYRAKEAGRNAWVHAD